MNNKQNLLDFSKDVISEIKKQDIKDQHRLNRLKLDLIKKHGIIDIPTNIDIASFASQEDRKLLKNILTIKPTRELSGVSVVAIMTKPIACQHGKCIYCPGGPDSVFGDIPQSYTGKEPAARRAIRNRFDSYLQVSNRIEQYLAMNKIPEKVELIIMGGTFPSFPLDYQDEFIKYAFKAMNDFSGMFFKKNKFDVKKFNEFFEIPGNLGDSGRIKRIQDKLLKVKNRERCGLEKEQEKNEKSRIRCVGLTIETRPDYGKLKHGNEILKLGGTRVELGIQSVYEDILKKINRCHTVKDSIESIRILKDLGFKLNFHCMPGLPGIDSKKDLEGMKQLFSDPDFRPDMLKIYPCMVLKGTPLYETWKKGKFRPIAMKDAARLIAEFKLFVPEYCRVMRVQRDIPTFVTEAGVERTNLRQYVEEEMRKKGIECRCIRCREVGLKIKKKKIRIDDKDIALLVIEYEASKGKEFFISFEDMKNNALLGFCRMRFPSQQLRKEITKKTALIRELHVYGKAVSLGDALNENLSNIIQHKGFGRKLLKKAESIAKENRMNKMVVISGVGVREYYRKLGYKKQGVYVVKGV